MSAPQFVVHRGAGRAQFLDREESIHEHVAKCSEQGPGHVARAVDSDHETRGRRTPSGRCQRDDCFLERQVGGSQDTALTVIRLWGKPGRWRRLRGRRREEGPGQDSCSSVLRLGKEGEP
jgi:hypothetical protein